MLDAQRIVILESRAGERLAHLVERLGGRPLWAPALAERPAVDPAQLRARLDQWEAQAQPLVLLQTGVGVAALFDGCAALGAEARLRALLARSRVAVRGPKPAAALRARGLRPDLEAAAPHTSVQLLEALRDEPLDGRAVLVLRHGGDSPELDAALAQRGARVAELVTYRWGLPQDTAPLQALLAALPDGVDAFVFTSRAQLDNLLAFAETRGCLALLRQALASRPVYSIGPVCTAALQARGIAVAGEADPPKLGPLMRLLDARLGRPAPAQAVVLFAHGARDPAWAQPVQEIRRRVAGRLPQAEVATCFLEHMRPSLPECLDALVAQGKLQVRLVPLFLGRGGHLREDLAQLLDAVQDRHPQLQLELLPALGEAAEILDAVAAWAAR